MSAGITCTHATFISTFVIIRLGFAFVRPPLNAFLPFFALAVDASIAQAVLLAPLAGSVIVATLTCRRTVGALDNQDVSNGKEGGVKLGKRLAESASPVTFSLMLHFFFRYIGQ